MDNLKININGKEVTAVHGQTILEVARQNGIEIPTLCYDERLKPYGGCGLCVVEVAGNPKLLRSCATEVAEGMVISTDSSQGAGIPKTHIGIAAVRPQWGLPWSLYQCLPGTR